MNQPRRAASVVLAAAVLVGVAGCTDDGGPSTGPASTTSAPPGSGAGDTGSAATDAPGNTAPPGREVSACASLRAPDLTGLGVEGLAVTRIEDVSAVLQGPADGGTGCLFSLTAPGAGSGNLTVLVHPDGGAYFDATVARLTDAEPIPGLGDDARSGSDSPDATTVITRRGPLVVEVRIGRSGILDRNLLIAIAGLTLEREDGP